MKKILVLFFAFLLPIQVLKAQKFFDIYNDGKIVGSILAEDIDSVRITGKDFNSRRINFFGSNHLSKSYDLQNIDSISIFRSNEEPLVYLGILGFNQNVYTKPLDVLASSTANQYSSFVNNLTRKDGSILYYAVDSALNVLSKYSFTTPINNVYLVTFTDGLDQGSLMLNGDYLQDSDYLTALNYRINNSVIRGLPITAYCLGLRGVDVMDNAMFKSNLQMLASSSDKAIEVSGMADVRSKMQDIAEHIINVSTRQNISMRIPGTSNGTRIRFTLDGKSPEESELYIEGTFNLSDRSLVNIISQGVNFNGGRKIVGEQDGIFVTFKFQNLQRSDSHGLILTNKIRQYNLSPLGTIWQINSEFNPDNDIQDSVVHYGSAIMLILDCSSSLGTEFSNMKSYAQNFISLIANNATPFSITAPQNVVASFNSNDTTINIQWDAVKYAQYYKLFRKTRSSYDFTLYADSILGTSWIDNKPIKGDNEYCVYAVGHGLTSPTGTLSNIVTNYFEPKPYYLWVPGNGNGWNHGICPILVSTDGENYSGYAYMEGEFKFTPVGEWSAEFNNGSFKTVTSNIDLGDGGGGSIKFVGEPGMYYLTVNTANKTISAVAVTWSVIGGFNFWHSDEVMTYDEGNHCLSVDVNFAEDTEWKFRRDYDWAVNFGGSLDALEQGGANFSATAGSHTIQLFIERPAHDGLHAVIK